MNCYLPLQIRLALLYFGGKKTTTWGAYHVAKISRNFGLKSNGEVNFRMEFSSEISISSPF